MFRVKVALTMVIVFATVGAFLYVTFSDVAATEARARVEQRLRVASRNLVRVRRLKDSAIVAKASEVAAWPQMAQILSKPIESYADEAGALPNDEEYRYQIHRLMNEEVLVWKTKFEALAAGTVQPTAKLADWLVERPDLFLVLDRAGIGVANAQDRAWFGPSQADMLKERPVLEQALAGKTLKDLWLVKGAPMAVAVAPVRKADKVVGAVVLGYRLTDSEAQRDKKLVETDVGYFLDGRLNQSSSFNSTTEQQLQQAVTDKNLPAASSEDVVEVTLNGQAYLGMVGKLSGYASAAQSGFVALDNLDAAVSMAREPLIWIPIACALGLGIILGLFIAFFQMFLRPFEEIDQGVMEIINGNLDYWFEVSGGERDLPKTMSQNLNIMVCNLSGRPLPDEDDAPSSGAWAGDRMFAEAMDGGSDGIVDAAAIAAGNTGGLSPAIVALVNEDAAAYQRRLFREYTEALRLAGQPVQGITFEAFTGQLESNSAALAKKYECSYVRFIVSSDGGKVRLRPVPIR